MLVRVLLVGGLVSEGALAGQLPQGVAAVERQSTEAFWQDPRLRPFDLVFVEFQDLPRDAGEAIARIRRLPQRPEVVVLGADLQDRDTLALQAAGCYAVVPARLAQDQVLKALAKLVSRRCDAIAIALRAQQAPRPLRSEDFVAESPATKEVLRIARRVAVSDTSLLLLGETGAGKEWLARAVHAESPRAKGPFIAINCGAIPEALLESELFGHERGAFTGAVRTRRGYFEQAHGGTLLLDEIGEMPAHLQVRLLRVLQERTIQRLGSEEPIAVDTRIIAATHRDLKAALEGGGFRKDLYYRLAVVTLTVPSLRDRLEDIPLLAGIYLKKVSRKLSRPEVLGISSQAMGALTSYAWPGNVRELINVIERAVLLCDSNEIGLVDLPVEIAAPAGGAILKAAGGSPMNDLDAWLGQPVEVGRLAVVMEFEHRYFSSLLQRNRGHVGRTAQQAGVDPRTLYNKMRQLGLKKADFKEC